MEFIFWECRGGETENKQMNEQGNSDGDKS